MQSKLFLFKGLKFLTSKNPEMLISFSIKLRSLDLQSLTLKFIIHTSIQNFKKSLNDLVVSHFKDGQIFGPYIAWLYS